MSQLPQDQRRFPRGTTPLVRLPRNVGTIAAPTSDVRRPIKPSASPAQNADIAVPRDLVARALEILAEETDKWRAGRDGDHMPGSAR